MCNHRAIIRACDLMNSVFALQRFLQGVDGIVPGLGGPDEPHPDPCHSQESGSTAPTREIATWRRRVTSRRGRTVGAAWEINGCHGEVSGGN